MSKRIGSSVFAEYPDQELYLKLASNECTVDIVASMSACIHVMIRLCVAIKRR